MNTERRLVRGCVGALHNAKAGKTSHVLRNCQTCPAQAHLLAGTVEVSGWQRVLHSDNPGIHNAGLVGVGGLERVIDVPTLVIPRPNESTVSTNVSEQCGLVENPIAVVANICQGVIVGTTHLNQRAGVAIG